MFIALFSTIMSSFSDVFWKKSLNFSVWSKAHELSSYIIAGWLLLYFLLTSFNYKDAQIISFFIVWAIYLVDIVRLPIMQKVYREEKISVIMPYLNLHKIFVIIASFFIFKDVSNIAFILTLVTICVIGVWSIDFKSFKLPRNLKSILLVEFLKWISILTWWWFVLKYGDTIFFNLYVTIWFFIIILLTLLSRQLVDLKKAPINYWKTRLLWSVWWFSWFLSLTVITNLWLSISVLLWFLWVWVTLLFSFIFLKDIPSIKNILLTVIVAVLIWAWYYFK